MSNLPSLSFDEWHVASSPQHLPGKEKQRALVSVHFDEILRQLFDSPNCLIARTLCKDCQFWFLLRMEVATSMVAREFNQSPLQRSEGQEHLVTHLDHVVEGIESGSKRERRIRWKKTMWKAPLRNCHEMELCDVECRYCSSLNDESLDNTSIGPPLSTSVGIQIFYCTTCERV